MTYSGNIRKMQSSLEDPVKYSLPIGDDLVDMNALLDSEITLSYAGEINCIACGRKTKKSFSQGYCYPCMQKLAECDMCIMRPETCHFHLGTCRDESWADDHCMQDHFVYLANSSGIKVGITRHTQIPTRWIDQGASYALPIFRVKNRLVSGLVEVALKEWVSDRTDWRKMLKGEPEYKSLTDLADEFINKCTEQLDSILYDHGSDAIKELSEKEIEIHYPVIEYPTKVSSLNLEKTPEINGKLVGIKGQYLILDCGVINMRKYTGYHLTLSSD